MGATRFFEGPEKKVELVVVPGFPSLRSLGEHTWRGVVNAARARVISALRNDHCDAYLLSESSLFVYDDYIVMITCGGTTLVDAVEALLDLIPVESVALLIYERKNEHFPERQPTTFYQDAQRLGRLIPGRALRFGEEHGHYVEMFCTTRPFVPERDDPTLEVLMHGIDERVIARFAAALPPEGHRQLEHLLPEFTISEYVFSPVGYSRNALRGEEYYTVHVTPEKVGSYVSFETNHDFRGNLTGLVRGVIALFQPRAFDVVTFVPEAPAELDIDQYQLGDHVVTTLGGYRVSYFQYYMPPVEPGCPYEFAL